MTTFEALFVPSSRNEEGRRKHLEAACIAPSPWIFIPKANVEQKSTTGFDLEELSLFLYYNN